MTPSKGHPAKRRQVDRRLQTVDSAVASSSRAPVSSVGRPLLLPGLQWSSDADEDEDDETDSEAEEMEAWKSRRSAWLAEYERKVVSYTSEGIEHECPQCAPDARHARDEARSAHASDMNVSDTPPPSAYTASDRLQLPAEPRGAEGSHAAAPIDLTDSGPKRIIVPAGEALRPTQSEPVAVVEPSAQILQSAVSAADISTASSRKGRGRRRGGTKVVKYESLTKKEKAKYSTIDSFVRFVEDTERTDSARSSPLSVLRVFYLLHPRNNGKLGEIEQKQLLGIVRRGGVVQTEMQLGVTTHIVTSHSAEYMRWSTCWDLLKDLLPDDDSRTQLRKLLEGPTDGVIGKDILWLLEPTWITQTLKSATKEPAPERHHRILARPRTSGASFVSGSSSRLIRNATAAVSEPPRPDDFIGPRTDTFQARYGNDSGSTQNSAFHSTDYSSSTTSPVIQQGLTSLGPSPPQVARPLPTTSSAPVHRALKRTLATAFEPAKRSETSDMSIDIENSGEVEATGFRPSEQVTEGTSAAQRVETELGAEIQLARAGQGGEWEEENFLYDYDEAYDSADGGSDEESHSRSRGLSKTVDDKQTAAKTRRVQGKYQCDRVGQGIGSKDGPNEDICEVLEKLIDLYGAQPNDTWRINGHRKAVGILRNATVRLDKKSDLLQRYGVGQQMADKIVEIARTGTHRRLTFSTEEDRVRKLFQGIYGVGMKTAGDWYSKGLRTLDDVRAGKGDVSLTEAQSLGIRFYDDLQQRIPRAEARKIYEHIGSTAKAIDPKLECHIMGSYRRGATTCGDIDILVTRNTDDGLSHFGFIKRLCKALFASSLMQYKLSEPEDWEALDAKFMGLCKLPGTGEHQRRIDILGVPYNEIGAALIYFTGDDIFNRSMRLKARHMGYSLNQRGLYADVIRDKNKGNMKVTEGRIVASQTEQEIFDLLKVTWVPPHLRNI